jgi:anti-anti-sigma factor
MKIVNEPDKLTLIVEQDITATNAQTLQKIISPELDQFETGHVTLDLSQIGMIDSIGLKLIVSLLKSCQNKGLTLSLNVKSDTIKKVISICGLNRILTVKED